MSRRVYKRLWARGCNDGIHYIAECEGEMKTFKNVKQLEKFLGYCARTIQRHLKTGKDICGWKITRHKWYEEVK